MSMHRLRNEARNINDGINTYECHTDVVGDARQVIKIW